MKKVISSLVKYFSLDDIKTISLKYIANWCKVCNKYIYHVVHLLWKSRDVQTHMKGRSISSDTLFPKTTQLCITLIRFLWTNNIWPVKTGYLYWLQKRKRKRIKFNASKINKQMHEKHIVQVSHFPKWDDHNAKRTEKHENNKEQSKTQHQTPHSKDYESHIR